MRDSQFGRATMGSASAFEKICFADVGTDIEVCVFSQLDAWDHNLACYHLAAFAHQHVLSEIPVLLGTGCAYLNPKS